GFLNCSEAACSVANLTRDEEQISDLRTRTRQPTIAFDPPCDLNGHNQRAAHCIAADQLHVELTRQLEQTLRKAIEPWLVVRRKRERQGHPLRHGAHRSKIA